MERKLLAGVAASLIIASAGAQTVPWNIQGNDLRATAQSYASQVNGYSASTRTALNQDPPDRAASDAYNAQADALRQAQQRASAQNDAATATGQGAATQSISQMMREMGVQAPIAGQ